MSLRSFEILSHKELKERAKTRLTKMGFKPGEVHEEYKVRVREEALQEMQRLHPRKLSASFRVDLVGISPTMKVAIECGSVPVWKLLLLKSAFDEVHHMDCLQLLWKLYWGKYRVRKCFGCGKRTLVKLSYKWLLCDEDSFYRRERSGLKAYCSNCGYKWRV